MKSTSVVRNPHMDYDDMFNYECVLTRENVNLRTFFSKGKALSEKPTCEEVLDCLAQEASGYENAASFEDWCDDFGYDTDSRKAERIWLAVVDGAKSLRMFLGSASTYEELLNETERE
jgi:hypothetical protein